MPNLASPEVADLLVEIGRRLELTGESRFKSKAYYRAAESLRRLEEPLAGVIEAGRLRGIPGVGEAIEEKIESLHRTGSHRTLERLRREAPDSLLELLDVPGLGPERIAKLSQTLGVTSLEELHDALDSGRIMAQKSLGARMAEKVAASLRLLRENRGKLLLHTAASRLESACALLLSERPEIEDALPAGPVRRGCEVVDSLVIAACAPRDPAAEALPGGFEVRLADRNRFGPLLLFATGSESHVRELATLAKEIGLELRPDGLFRGRALIPCPGESEVYSAMGLPFIPPEMREGEGEIALAKTGKLPELVTLRDARGILHAHTSQSDGTESLEDMALAAQRAGYAYLGIADHSQSAGYAGGLKPGPLLAQRRQVDSINARSAQQGAAFRVFHGIESDIRLDGSLDYPDDILARLDFVVASVHNRFRLSREEQTRRIVKAVRSPYTTILGHPTGRLLLQRDPYEVDMEAILAACAEHGVAVEINANPHRLDLDWRWHRRALELGCLLSIDPDAHSPEDYGHMRWGTAIARKGGVTAERVLSCWPLDRIADHFRSRQV